jgi:hypothetical protein
MNIINHSASLFPKYQHSQAQTPTLSTKDTHDTQHATHDTPPTSPHPTPHTSTPHQHHTNITHTPSYTINTPTHQHTIAHPHQQHTITHNLTFIRNFAPQKIDIRPAPQSRPKSYFIQLNCCDKEQLF